jgi:hypothetical protein
MNTLLMYGIFLLAAIVNNAYAGTDMQCVTDCQSRGYLTELCMQRCSFGDDNPPLPKIDNSSIPMSMAPAPAQAVQPDYIHARTPVDANVEQLKALQIEVQKQQLEKQLMELQRQNNEEGQPAQSVAVNPANVRPLYNTRAEWVKFYTDNSTTGYADTATVRKNGDMVNIWWMSDSKKAIPLPNGSMSSFEFQDEIDCKEMRFRRNSFTPYSGNMGGGNALKNIDYESPKWDAVKPGGVLEALRNYVCGGNAQPATLVTESSQSKSSVASRLSELNKLLQDGLITRKDFDAKKQEILKGL